jgi:hypothetical protein
LTLIFERAFRAVEGIVKQAQAREIKKNKLSKNRAKMGSVAEYPPFF